MNERAVVPANHSNEHEREFIVLIAFMMSVVAISIDALLPSLDFIRKDLLIANPNHAQLLISFIFIGLAVGELIAGPFSDSIGRKPVLYIGLAIFFAGSLICFFANSLEILLLGRLIQGIGVSGPYTAAISIVRDKYSGANMAKIMSLVMMIFITVPAIAPSLGEAILYIASWRHIFVMYIFYSLIISTWIFFRLEETLEKKNRIPMTLVSFKHGLIEVITHRATFSYTLCMGICFGSFIGYLNSSQQIFQSQFQVGKLFSLYFGILALTLGLASLTNSRFVEKFGMHLICLRSFQAIVAISAIFIGLHYICEIQLWMFLTYAIILFFSFGLIFGNINALAMEPMGHIAGMAAAITGSLSSVMALIIGTFIGQLYHNDLTPIVFGFLFFGLLSIVLLIFAKKEPAKMLTSSS